MAVDASQVSQLDVEPGELPPTMAAWVIREERQGEPRDAFQIEEIEVPEPAAVEVIVRGMAAGADGGVEEDLAGPRVEERQHLLGEDRHVARAGACTVFSHEGPSRRRDPRGKSRSAAAAV